MKITSKWKNPGVSFPIIVIKQKNFFNDLSLQHLLTPSPVVNHVCHNVFGDNQIMQKIIVLFLQTVCLARFSFYI